MDSRYRCKKDSDAYSFFLIVPCSVGEIDSKNRINPLKKRLSAGKDVLSKNVVTLCRYLTTDKLCWRCTYPT